MEDKNKSFLSLIVGFFDEIICDIKPHDEDLQTFFITKYFNTTVRYEKNFQNSQVKKLFDYWKTLIF